MLYSNIHSITASSTIKEQTTHEQPVDRKQSKGISETHNMREKNKVVGNNPHIHIQYQSTSKNYTTEGNTPNDLVDMVPTYIFNDEYLNQKDTEYNEAPEKQPIEQILHPAQSGCTVDMKLISLPVQQEGHPSHTDPNTEEVKLTLSPSK